jgi:hypothetical protein
MTTDNRNYIQKSDGEDATDAALHSKINTPDPGQSTPDSDIQGHLL